MHRALLIIVSFFTILASGCTTVQDYHPVTKNGQEYVYGMPVLAVGTLEEVQVTGKDGAVHAITAGAKDITSDGAIAGSLASNISGMSNAQAGAALGLASGVFDFVSRLSGPSIKLLVRQDNGGEILTLPVSKDSLYILGTQRCINVGDRVRVVKKGARGFDVYNANPDLMNFSVFQPSCEELKAKLAQ